MIRKMFEQGAVMKRKYGADKVFDFSLGNPNVEPPAVFKRELIRLAAKPLPPSTDTRRTPVLRIHGRLLPSRSVKPAI